MNQADPFKNERNNQLLSNSNQLLNNSVSVVEAPRLYNRTNPP